MYTLRLKASPTTHPVITEEIARDVCERNFRMVVSVEPSKTFFGSTHVEDMQSADWDVVVMTYKDNRHRPILPKELQMPGMHPMQCVLRGASVERDRRRGTPRCDLCNQTHTPCAGTVHRHGSSMHLKRQCSLYRRQQKVESEARHKQEQAPRSSTAASLLVMSLDECLEMQQQGGWAQRVRVQASQAEVVVEDPNAEVTDDTDQPWLRPAPPIPSRITYTQQEWDDWFEANPWDSPANYLQPQVHKVKSYRDAAATPVESGNQMKGKQPEGGGIGRHKRTGTPIRGDSREEGGGKSARTQQYGSQIGRDVRGKSRRSK